MLAKQTHRVGDSDLKSCYRVESLIHGLSGGSLPTPFSLSNGEKVTFSLLLGRIGRHGGNGKKRERRGAE